MKYYFLKNVVATKATKHLKKGLPTWYEIKVSLCFGEKINMDVSLLLLNTYVTQSLLPF